MILYCNRVREKGRLRARVRLGLVLRAALPLTPPLTLTPTPPLTLIQYFDGVTSAARMPLTTWAIGV